MSVQIDFCSSDVTTTAVINNPPKKTSIGFRPLGDRVLIRVLPPNDEMKNGLYVPDTAKEKPQEGEVLAVGNGRVFNGERIPLDVRVGQRVSFGKYSGNEIEVKNERLLILQEPELHGYYED